MLDKYQQHLLNVLLDKYEKSKHWKEEARVQRRVSFPFSRDQYPDYHLEGLSSQTDSINAVAIALEKSKVVQIKWVRSEVGNLIENLYLNLDQVENAYRMANRVPLRDDIESMQQKLIQVKGSFTIKWIVDFIEHCLEQLNNKKLPAHLGKEEKNIDLLFNSLIGIQEIHGEIAIPERLFSIRYLGNSKTFEKYVRSRVVAIYKKFRNVHQIKEGILFDEMEEEDILQEIGILKSIEELMVRGTMQMKLKDSLLDYTPFVYGNVLDSHSIRLGKITDIQTDTLLIIENKAVFKELVRCIEEGKPLFVGEDRISLTDRFRDCIVVYLGGFPGPDKRLFFNKFREFVISNYLGEIDFKYYFWGDLDYGGVQIYRHLKSVELPELQPFLMDIGTWEYYKSFAELIDSDYKKKLIKLLGAEDVPELKKVLEAMIYDELRLEQESMLIGE